MKKLTLILGIFIGLVSTSANARSLAEQLAEKAKAGKAPAEIKKIMSDAISELRNSEVMKTAKKKGEQMPSFRLNDIKRGVVDSGQLLKKGSLVVAFYRGGWCPYCNLQLRDLQMYLAEIKKAGAELVAISPEAPDQTAETVKKGRLDFYVLSDVDGSVGQAFGLTYSLPKDLVEVYKKFGINLSETNANKKWELPVSATYIVNKDGQIVYSYVDADYKKRAETTELIKILKTL